jgi:hypothetical protein
LDVQATRSVSTREIYDGYPAADSPRRAFNKIPKNSRANIMKSVASKGEIPPGKLYSHTPDEPDVLDAGHAPQGLVGNHLASGASSCF